MLLTIVVKKHLTLSYRFLSVNSVVLIMNVRA